MLTTGDKATVVDTDVARVVLVNKPAGLTPLAAIERLRRARPDAVGGREARVGYAGRLDPLARGLLVCVAGPPDGPSLARQKSLETQHKVLFGVATDTYDVMGLVSSEGTEEQTEPPTGDSEAGCRRQRRRQSSPCEDDGRAADGDEEEEEGELAEPVAKKAMLTPPTAAEGQHSVEFGHEEKRGSEEAVELNKAVEAILPSFVGRRQQAYPPFSSARVKGKPLFHWARQGAEKMKEIAPLIPRVEVEIQRLELLSTYTLTMTELRREVRARIGAVSGDFRQEQILQSWDNHYFSRRRDDESVTIFQMRAEVTSGTYIRSLAHDMGRMLGIGGVAFDIYRTRVGDYSIDEAITLPP